MQTGSNSFLQVSEVKVQRVIVSVKGMSCESCVNHVKMALREVSGVIHASANYETEKATVTSISGCVSVEDLARAIESAGYRIPEI